MIVVANKRRKRERLLQEYPGATIVDITSRAEALLPPWGHSNTLLSLGYGSLRRGDLAGTKGI